MKTIWEVWGEKYLTIQEVLVDDRAITAPKTIATVNTAFISLEEAKKNAEGRNMLQEAVALLKTTTEWDVLESFKEKVKKLEI